MIWRHGPWHMVARLTHLSAPAQRRLWRILIFGWTMLLLAAWAGLSALTRVQEKAVEEAGQAYVAVAPLAAEVMDLRQSRGQLESQPPLLAAEQVARGSGIEADRLSIQLAPAPAPDAPQALTLRAQNLTLRELVEILRDLKVEAGLTTVSAHLVPSASHDNRMDLDLVLSR